MKRYRIWMLGAFVVITALLVGTTMKVRQNPSYQLSHYSRAPALKRYVSYVSTELEYEFSNGESILDIHEPIDGSVERVLSYEINSGGSFKLNVITPEKSGGYFQQANLSPAQLASVKRLIKQLPSNAPPEKPEDVIVVLTDHSTPQRLRLYDRRHLPPQIRQIIGILTTAMEVDLNSLLPRQNVRDLPHLRSKLRPSNSQDAIN